ncbi:hypothetical protein QJ856_gp1033 [Tupanvirus deep ocean]|uniref:Uncharacterized protein n=2 Tax=Tupanvirus TaxID=2094720 RepID=A0AC62A7M9_9VIRU|nr:hypothetical protein QJ856_gp1033 [Tupanvirus deep ocean]QKU33724.1 hypothetical protein [Tupanvirus deep ocean]
MSNTFDVHNKAITATKYFTIDDAINSPIKSKTAFVIANERITQSGHIGRYYTVFPSFKEFLKNREKFKHCHEILVDHINNKPNLAGRLVFDFDIKNVNSKDDNPNSGIFIPKNFKEQIENNIIEVIERYFNSVDTNKFEFIWSTSQNPKKFSKHLTVKNLYFDNWMTMSKTFYKLFCIVWDETHSWMKSSKLIDFQIVRNRGSLRMVGSTKIDGYPLVFDNEKHKLTDSLIRIYFKTQKEQEQLVTENNINKSVFDNVLYCETDEISEQQHTINFEPKKIEKPAYDKIIFEKAFNIYNGISPGVFKMGKINGKVLSLIRKKPNKCLMSGKIHDQENAFLIINKGDSEYSVRFGCFRYCHRKKTVYIGSITLDNHITMINPNFETREMSNKRNKKPRIVEI